MTTPIDDDDLVVGVRYTHAGVPAAPTAPDALREAATDDIDEFMSSVAEWVALTAYRLAHSPLQREVPPDELAAYSRAKAALRRSLAPSTSPRG